MPFPGKKALSHQISNAIKKKWNKECVNILEEVINENTVNGFDNTTENGSAQNISAMAFSRIKERLEAVEELNDHLCYYISFLIENLPELIIKTIQSSDDIDFLIEKSHGKFHTNGALDNKPEFPLPTRREHDVLELLERGLCAKEIATRLYISETTVITHKKNLKKKFNVKNTAELISKIRSGT
jgi:DNA-binding CsgD family transcriptional regulator